MDSFRSESFFSAPSLFKLLIVMHLLIYIPQVIYCPVYTFILYKFKHISKMQEFVVMRSSMYQILGWESVTDIAHVALTVATLALAVLLACYLIVNTDNAFQFVISLSGGVCSSIIVFIMPGLMAASIYGSYHNGDQIDSPLDYYCFIAGIFVATFGVILMLSSLAALF